VVACTRGIFPSTRFVYTHGKLSLRCGVPDGGRGMGWRKIISFVFIKRRFCLGLLHKEDIKDGRKRGSVKKEPGRAIILKYI
jgi:hypothetical protein